MTSKSIKSNGASLKSPDHQQRDAPWYDAAGKRFMLVLPLVILIGNSLISMTINSSNLATTRYGPYGQGPVRLSTPADQKEYGNRGYYEDLWGTGTAQASTTFINSQTRTAVGFMKSIPAFHYVSCREGRVSSAHVTCDFSSNIAFDGLVGVFVAYTAVFVTIIAVNCFYKYSPNDLRFFINAEKFKSSRLSSCLIVLGYMITFAGFALGMYYAHKNAGGPEDYGRQLIFLSINAFAFHKLGFSVFSDLAHLDLDAELSEEIFVLPFYDEERCFSNGWGCMVRPEFLIRKLEQAVLRAYIHKAPEHVVVYGNKEKLERALLLIHLARRPTDDKLPALLRRSSTLRQTAADTSDSLLRTLTRWLLCNWCARDSAAAEEEQEGGGVKGQGEEEGGGEEGGGGGGEVDWVTKRAKYERDMSASLGLFDRLSRCAIRLAGRFLFVVPVAILAINSLSNVATIAQTAATTTYSGYPLNTGNGKPFLLDSVASQEYALQMQEGRLFQPSTSPNCQNILNQATCLQANLTGVSCSFGYGLLPCIMPQWNKCGSDTRGVLEAGYTCSYLQSSLFYTLIFIWVGWAAVVLAGSLAYSFSYDVHDARFPLCVEHFRGSLFNRTFILLAMLYTLATGVTAVVFTSGFSVITYFNVLLYVCLNIRALSSLASVTSPEIPRLNLAVDFPEAVIFTSALVVPTDVLYSLEQALLKTFLTQQDKYIQRVADKAQVEKFLARAYLHDLSVSTNGGEAEAGDLGDINEQESPTKTGGYMAAATAAHDDTVL